MSHESATSGTDEFCTILSFGLGVIAAPGGRRRCVSCRARRRAGGSPRPTHNTSEGRFQ